MKSLERARLGWVGLVLLGSVLFRTTLATDIYVSDAAGNGGGLPCDTGKILSCTIKGNKTMTDAYDAVAMNKTNAATSLTIGDPVIVAQASPELDRAGAGWGRWQFPVMSRLADGQIHVGFSVEPDSAASYGKPMGHAYSKDDGQTWRMGTLQVGHEAEQGIFLPNGDRLKAVQQKSRKAEEFALPASVCDFVCSYGYPRSLYRAADLPRELTEWRFSRLPAGKRQWIEERAGVQIPEDVRVVVVEKPKSALPGSQGVGPVREGVLALPFLWGKMRLAPDQSLWAATYDYRRFGGKPFYAPIFLRSTDLGHTWTMLSAIRYQGDRQADPFAEKRDGFTEPDYAFMPDGSVICLMRTMDGNGRGPLYLARSVDQGRTWSRPVVFDNFGKMPQLLPLGKGITLAAYGASGGPGYFVVRATSDPSGQAWEAPVRMAASPPAPGAWDTCGHTEMVALDDHRALIVYSDFNYPDQRGIKRKTILVRQIRVGKPQ